ncbi:MAG: hypothetical protein PHO15_07415 [Eubacteriales bacterium]|nr:hypothetical protein [Eubacteriales bacterium]
MVVYDTMSFPFAEFGEGLIREIRIIVAPELSDEDHLSLVHTSIPPYAVSEGHIHEDFDEYIFFNTAGKVIVDGVEYDVPSQGVVHAKAGSQHECINIHPNKTLRLLCIFVPSLKPYGKYLELIEDTKNFLIR